MSYYLVISLEQLPSTFMANPSYPLLERQRWAEHALSHVLGSHESGSLLWQPRVIGTSSMFSGACYPERALAYIDSARRGASESVGALSVSWLWWFGLRGSVCVAL